MSEEWFAREFGPDPSDVPIYLHFLNRELARAVDISLPPERLVQLMATAALVTKAPLYSSIALVWESGVLETRTSHVVRLLLQSGSLQLISEFVSVGEFVSACQDLYEADARRYPMYFGRLPGDYLAARPSIQKVSSTTEALEAELRDFGDGAWGPILGGMPKREQRALSGAREAVEQRLSEREHQALTVSYFSPVVGEGRHWSLARALSLLHLDHYLRFTSADILTGIAGIEYFDRLARYRPRFDVRLVHEVLRWAGCNPVELVRHYAPLLGGRGGEQHSVCVDLLQQLILGLEYICRASPMGAPESALEPAARLLFGAGPPGQASRDRVADLLNGLLRLTLYAKQNPQFAAFMEKYMAVKSRARNIVAFLTATDRETEEFVSIAERDYGWKCTRVPLGDHTILHFGIHQGVEVALVQSEMGTESPGAMTLTSADVISMLRPRYVILVGIAFGLKRGEQKVGDILVSKQLEVCDVRKITNKREWVRGDRVEASTKLLDRFRVARLDWRGPKPHFGLLLSSNSLVNSVRRVRELKALEPDAIGGEMEGAGVYCAAASRKVDWVVVKAIADWGYNKSDAKQRAAARNAARYALHVVKGGGL